ncbi:nuclear body protein SP140-like protein isoform X2 [Myotis lucifugus]|uniref:nuclear body protein SP140-like protein isoform X2 n=1 Tax=Myotis lucifugus TaxID=59463 RepID=UPI000CCBEECC|nr:nuclear body protein SP140-like protein isoform X2 [Myotis lucifugus]
MASGGSYLSTRMSEEEKRIYDIALCHFKREKVTISNIIKVAFPFLELLRDYGFINNEMYESKESFKTPGYEKEVIYHVLDEVEKSFNLSLLEALFRKDIMDTYRGLNDIYKVFKKVIPNIQQFLRSNGEDNEERPDIQQSLEQGTAPPVNGLSEQYHETQEINVNETGTTSNNNDALESRQGNEQCAQESEQDGVEPPRHGNQINNCSVHLVNIKEEDPSLNSDVEWEAQARNDCNQASDIIVIDSDDSRESSDGDVPPKASSSALKRKSGTVDFGNNSISEKAKKRRRGKLHTDVEVDYTAEILPVTCGEKMGMLIKRKLKRGATVKCIRREDGNWCTPREFEVEGGYGKSSNWKNSVYCGGTALKNLKEYLPELPGKGGVKKKLENTVKCKICEDEGKLFNCSRCFSFFHEDCHIPPVDPTRIREWRCTFCTIQVSLRSQQCCSESEVLKRQMGPEEKLKCECLLLKVYYHLESKIFLNIPHEHYVQKASQCLETLKGLDEIKKSLIEGHYPQVKEFVLKMNNIFQDHKHYDSDLTEEEFKKNFKDVFAIQ